MGNRASDWRTQPSLTTPAPPPRTLIKLTIGRGPVAPPATLIKLTIGAEPREPALGTAGSSSLAGP